MEYIAILGRQPELGLVELESIVGSDDLQAWGNQAALITQELDLGRLGGAQKLGRVLYRGPQRDLNETPISLDDLPTKTGKTTFGISMYGVQASQKFVIATGLTLKKRLKSKGSIRFVAPQTGTHLTAAQVKFNGLLRNGFELLVVVNKNQMVVGITEQFQDIDWYATRDYQRPTRSAKIGMLPPKLAQIMVNTTTAPLVYDPFCGTGVVLQESLLLGRSAAGSDLNPDMVSASQDNLAWLDTQRLNLSSWEVREADARKVTLPSEPLAIVSEGYLGEHLSTKPDQKTYKRLDSELTALWGDTLKHLHGQLEAGSEVTITVPVWHTTSGWRALQIIDLLPDLGYTLRSFAHVDSRNLIYRRPNQIVGRQLLILRKA